MRDTLMLARGVEAVVQCAPRLAEWLDMPTIRRGESARRLRGGSAVAQPAASSRLDARTPCRRPAALRQKAEPSARIGWFARGEPPAGVAVERDQDRIARYGLVVGDDGVPTHLAAGLGIPTILLSDRFRRLAVGSTDRNVAVVSARWNVIGEDETEKLAARLGRC